MKPAINGVTCAITMMATLAVVLLFVFTALVAAKSDLAPLREPAPDAESLSYVLGPYQEHVLKRYGLRRGNNRKRVLLDEEENVIHNWKDIGSNDTKRVVEWDVSGLHFRVHLYPHWNIQVNDTRSDVIGGSPYLKELDGDSRGQRLGFGQWMGKNIKIYAGYLTRLGLITYWRYVKHVSHWTVAEDGKSVTFLVETSDSDFHVIGGQKYRKILVKLFGFNSWTSTASSRFQMEATVVERDGKTPDAAANRIGMGFATETDSHGEDEGFFGFGERFNNDNQMGNALACYTEDGGWDLGFLQNVSSKYRFPTGKTATYIPMPQFFSNRGYMLHLDTTYRSVFDFRHKKLSKNGGWNFLVESNSFTFTTYRSENPNALMYHFTDPDSGVGRSLIPPPWQFGPWSQLNGEIKNITRDPYEVALKFLEWDIPVSHSVNTVHFLPTFSHVGSEERLKRSNMQMRSLGVHQTAYFNPYVRVTVPAYEYCKKNNYFVNYQDEDTVYKFKYIGTKLFEVSQIDFTNPEACAWYKGLLHKAMVEIGFSGSMVDYGEYTEPRTLFNDTRRGDEYRNAYPLMYHKCHRDFYESLDPNPNDPYAPDFVYYIRSGYLTSQRYAYSTWTGDPSSDWSYAAGMPSQIPASVNIGLGGMPYSGSDIGGFEWWLKKPPTVELWCRWTQLGAFSGLFHDQAGGNGIGEKTHILDTIEGRKCWRRYSKMRTQLFPYLYNAAHEAYFVGLSLMRHFLLHYPSDRDAILRHGTYQYMLGRDLLVAPVTDEGALEKSVYLPQPETWVDVSSHMIYDESDGRMRIGFGELKKGGAVVTVSAARDEIPLFVRAGSIIRALDPSVFTLAHHATNQSIVTREKRKNIVHMFVWPDREGKADGVYNDGLDAHMESLTFRVEKKKPNATRTEVVIVQMALYLTSQEASALQVIADNDGKLTESASWKELTSVEISGRKSGFHYDSKQHVLWIRMQPSDSMAKIMY